MGLANFMNNTPVMGKTLSSPAAQQAQQMQPEQQISTCLNVVENALDDVKAKNVTILNVTDLTDVTDRIVIADGTSTRHVKALADHVAESAKKAGFRPLGVEGERDAEWILIDLGLVVVHVMLPQARQFYDLESLWQPVLSQTQLAS